jgi:hypothetical protein
MPNVENVGQLTSTARPPIIAHAAVDAVNRPYLAAVQLRKFAPDFPLSLR